MIDKGLIQSLVAYKYRKDTERLCNCETHFPQLEELPEYVIDELVRKYTYPENKESK
jgi:hypothetical protein